MIIPLQIENDLKLVKAAELFSGDEFVHSRGEIAAAGKRLEEALEELLDLMETLGEPK
jgi:hypothetical protein